MRYSAILATIIMLLVGTLAAPAQASRQRNRADEVVNVPARVFQPAAAAPGSLSAQLLSGLDYTAITPPGMRLRVIEDEPYIHLAGQPGLARPHWQSGRSTVVLRSETLEGGWYEARVSLRVSPDHSPTSPLVLSFDTAAHYAYQGDLVFAEDRGEIIYSLSEIRSPLGLTDPDDESFKWREYLAYTAAVLNPIGWDQAAPELLPATPYEFVNGELRMLRVADHDLYMLTIEFEASEYPYSLGLSENIARCVLNRLQPKLKPKHALSYLAYHPEYEPALPYFENEPIDLRTSDLVEQPGEGCGSEPLAITGDVCPDCLGGGPHWPAAPYRDVQFRYQLPGMAVWPQCSHCLLAPLGVQNWDKFKQTYWQPGVDLDRTCDGCPNRKCSIKLCSSQGSCSICSLAHNLSTTPATSLSPWSDPLLQAGITAEATWEQGSAAESPASLLSQVSRSF